MMRFVFSCFVYWILQTNFLEENQRLMQPTPPSGHAQPKRSIVNFIGTHIMLKILAQYDTE